MVNYEDWQKISPENCIKCKFGGTNYAKIGKAKCFYPKPKTRFIQGKGWVCREFEVNK